MVRQPNGAPARLEKLAEKIIGKLPDSVLLIGTIPPLRMGGGKAVDEYNAGVSKAVSTLAGKGSKVALVDHSKVKVNDLKDGVHPNDAGYTKMADAWFSAIENVAAKGWIKNPS